MAPFKSESEFKKECSTMFLMFEEYFLPVLTERFDTAVYSYKEQYQRLGPEVTALRQELNETKKALDAVRMLLKGIVTEKLQALDVLR